MKAVTGKSIGIWTVRPCCTLSLCPQIVHLLFRNRQFFRHSDIFLLELVSILKYLLFLVESFFHFLLDFQSPNFLQDELEYHPLLISCMVLNVGYKNSRFCFMNTKMSENYPGSKISVTSFSDIFVPFWNLVKIFWHFRM